MSDIVQYRTEGRVAIITLNRPEARNAVNGDVAAGVEAAIDQMEDDAEIWVGIITANTEGQDRCSRPAPTSRRSTRATPPR